MLGSGGKSRGAGLDVVLYDRGDGGVGGGGEGGVGKHVEGDLEDVDWHLDNSHDVEITGGGLVEAAAGFNDLELGIGGGHAELGGDLGLEGGLGGSVERGTVMLTASLSSTFSFL